MQKSGAIWWMKGMVINNDRPSSLVVLNHALKSEIITVNLTNNNNG